MKINDAPPMRIRAVWAARGLVLTVCLVALCCSRDAMAQSTAFNYQGILQDASGKANGVFDIVFTLFDSETNGSPLAGPVTNAAVVISNGLFNATVDFGAYPFSGEATWLEIGARANGAAVFSVLSPRQAMLPSPSAIYATYGTFATYATYATSAGSAANVRASSILGRLSMAQLPPALVTNGAAGVSFLDVTVGGNLNLPATGVVNVPSLSVANPAPNLIGASPFARGIQTGIQAGRSILTNLPGFHATNLYADTYRRVLGAQNLLPWQSYVQTNRTANKAQIILIGPSTTYGADMRSATGRLPAALQPQSLLQTFAAADGLGSDALEVVNLGANGTTSWFALTNQVPQATNIASADGGISTLIVFDWGASDYSLAPYQPPFGAPFSAMLISNAIMTVQTSLPNASIILKNPNAMSDDSAAKCEAVFEAYAPFGAWTAASLHCAWFDCNAEWSDARNSWATNWMDQQPGTAWPCGVHPVYINWLIWRQIYEMAVPRGLAPLLSGGTNTSPNSLAVANLAASGNLTVGGAITVNGVRLSSGDGAIQANAYGIVESGGFSGLATLSNGVATVSTSVAPASDNARIFLTAQDFGQNTGCLGIANLVAGSSFQIRSTNPGDTNRVAWMIFTPR